MIEVRRVTLTLDRRMWKRFQIKALEDDFDNPIDKIIQLMKEYAGSESASVSDDSLSV